MKARENDLEKFVGKTISDGGSKSVFKCVGKSVFKCVGYNLITGLLIVDAGKDGWRGLDIDDVVDRECENYWYVSPLTARIIK